MILKVCFFLFLSSIISSSFGEDIFKVAPYSLKHTNGRLILNFQLNMDKDLTIEDGRDTHASFLYKKNQHYQRELSLEECGGAKDLRIRDNSSNEIIFSKNYPLPACEAGQRAADFTFGFISDTQQFINRHEAVAKIIAYHHSLEPLQFLINGGDIVQTGKDEREWIEYFKGGQSYIMDIPQIAAVGNHDYRGDHGKEDNQIPKLFKKYLRWEGAPSNGNLFFELPGIQLVIWNSNSVEIPNKEELIMWAWLEEKMAAAQKKGVPLILATHFPVYSSTINKYFLFPIIKIRRKLIPLAEKYGVKLILSGHNHMYERSYKNGVNYLVAGPAGGRPSKPTFRNPYMQKIDSDALTFTKIKFSNKAFTIQTYNQDNALIDQLFVNL